MSLRTFYVKDFKRYVDIKAVERKDVKEFRFAGLLEPFRKIIV